jgi:hypothetical protein
VKNSQDCKSFQRIFEYLEDTKIQNDESGIINCIYCVAKMNFKIYFDSISKQPKSESTNFQLESLTKFLLDKIKISNEKLSFLVNFILDEIMKKFPFLILSEQILFCLMENVDFAGYFILKVKFLFLRVKN